MLYMYKYWGKADKNNSYHLLVYHCLDVAAVGKTWLEHNRSISFVKQASKASGLPKEAFIEWFVFFLALHDLGKFEIHFQNFRPDLLNMLQQKKCAYSSSIRHDQYGYYFWKERILKFVKSAIFEKTESQDIFCEWLNIFAKVVMGHHGIPPSEANSFSMNLNESDIDSALNFSKFVLNLFVTDSSRNSIINLCQNNGKLFDNIENSLKYFSWKFAGLTTLCDWIASGDEIFNLCSKKIPLEEYFNNSCNKAKKALERTGVISPPLSKQQGMKHLFPDFANNPTPLQAFCNKVKIKSTPQLWILEDVTGAGKTEAALVLASRILSKGNGSGCFVALPTMATSNAMYERMVKVYSRLYENSSYPSLSLSHSSRHLSKTFRESYKTNLNNLPQDDNCYDENSDESKAHCSQWLADNSKKALLSDVGIGTIDQILMACLPFRYQSLRVFGISQKVLIIDEVHAYDPYVLQLLIYIIHAQAVFNGSVILLSATLPFVVREKFCKAFADGLDINNNNLLQKKDIFPLVTSTTNDGISETGVKTRNTSSRIVKVIFCEDEDTEFIYNLVKKSVKEGKCICWIRNTISDVTESYNYLRNQNVENLDMFHSRFALKDRIEIENRILLRFGKKSTFKERYGQILVASQVVEQSLDLDFDVMISDLAPIDLLIQRAGRLHRHQRGDRGEPIFYVHSPKDTERPTENWFADKFPKAAFVYEDVSLLWRTKEILKKRKCLKMPEEARVLIEAVYGNNLEPTLDVFISSEDKAWAKNFSERGQAKFNKLKFEQGYTCMSNSINKWESEERVPTRLADKTNKLYLCKWSSGVIVPLFKDEQFSWDLSSLSLRDSLLSQIKYNDEITDAINDLKKQKRFKYNSIFLVFIDNLMELNGEDENGNDVVVKYNTYNGLTVKKK